MRADRARPGCAPIGREIWNGSQLLNYTLIGVGVYIAVQLGIGFYVSRRIKDETDYVLAGRSFGYLLATFSIFATWFGAETCIGSTAEIHKEGLSAAAHDPLGYALCILLMGLVLAKPLWNRGLMTLSDLFRQRYSPGVERLATLMMVPTSLLWAAAQVRAFGQILAASSTLSTNTAIAIAAGVVIIYTTAGGLMADAITDILQGGILIIGLILAFIAIISSVGGVSAALSEVDTHRLTLFPSHGAWHATWLINAEAWLVPICGSVVAQELIARVLAARSPTVARRACFGATAIYLVIGMIPMMIGLLGPHVVPDIEDPEHLLATVVRMHVGPVLYIIFIGALLSAILSTVDSALLAASALTTENLIGSWRAIPSQHKLRINRMAVMSFGVIAYFFAVFGGGVFELVVDASSFGSAGIVVIVFFGLFRQRGGRYAAYAALVFGMSAWMTMRYYEGSEYPYIVALATAMAAYLIVERFEPGASKTPEGMYVRAGGGELSAESR